MAAPSANEQSKDDSQSVVYAVQTAFENLDKGLLLFSSTVIYFGEMLVTHPLEVIRTSVQVSQAKSSIDIIKQKLAKNGPKSLYAGFWPATIGHLPGNTIYLVAYTYLKDRLQQVENARHPGVVPDGRQAAWVSFSAAMGADLAAVGLYCPVDVVVQRLFLQSAHQPKYSGYRDVIETIMKTEGWKGFYRGVGPILVNSLPASAVWWTLYEECKTWFSVWLEDYWYKSSVDHTASGAHVVHKHALANIAAGGLAGAVVTFLTNPLDVVRTRLQTQSMEAEAYHYNSAMHTIREMWAAEGVKAFFKGTTPRLTQWVVFSSASAFAYEFIVDISTIKK